MYFSTPDEAPTCTAERRTVHLSAGRLPLPLAESFAVITRELWATPGRCGDGDTVT
jgi:hypothetical protein